LYRFALSLEIAAPPSRVWRALCDPEEVAGWDPNIIQAMDAPPDYPKPGQHVQWLCGGAEVLHDRPQEVIPEQKLRSILQLGRTRFDETYTLTPMGEDKCLLRGSIELVWGMPLLGRFMNDRKGRESTIEFGMALTSLKRWCEA